MSWTPYLQSPWPPFHLERILGADDRGPTVAGSASGDFESASALLAMQSRENHGQRGLWAGQLWRLHIYMYEGRATS